MRSLVSRYAAILAAAVIAVAGVGVWHYLARSQLSRTVLGGLILAVVGGVVFKIGLDWAAKKPREVPSSAIRLTKVAWYRRKGRAGSFGRPQFFRAPPCFVDFQQQYVVPHPLLASLQHEMASTTRGVIVVEGPPAAGKSILLRSLEFYLRTGIRRLRHRHVFLVACKDLDDEAAERMSRALREQLPRRSIVLIDDLHLHLLRLSSAASEIAREREALFICVTRPLDNYAAADSENLRAQYPILLHTTADSVSDAIIAKYLERRTGGAPHSGEIARFRPFTDDLWVLSAALESCVVGTGYLEVSHELVHGWIVNELVGTDRIEGVGRRTVLAVLAAMYRYEVAVELDFFTEQLGVPADVLTQMVRSGDVLRQGTAIRIHHSSLAALIIRSLDADTVGARVPRKLRELEVESDSHWADRIVLYYVRQQRHIAGAVLVQLYRSSEDGRFLAKSILTNVEVTEVIEASVRPESLPLESLGTLARLCRASNVRVPDTLRQRVQTYAHGETDPPSRVWALAWAVACLTELQPALAEPLIPRLAQALTRADVELVARIGTTLSYVDRGVAKLAVTDVAVDDVRAGLSHLTASTRAMVVAKLVWVSESLGAGVSDWSEIFKGASDHQLAALVGRVAWGNPAFATRLLAASDMRVLSDTLLSISDLRHQLEFVGALINVDPSSAIKVFEHGLASDQLSEHSSLRQVLREVTSGPKDRSLLFSEFAF